MNAVRNMCSKIENLEQLNFKRETFERQLAYCYCDIRQEQNECNHELVLLLGDNDDRTASIYVCPICGLIIEKSNYIMSDNKFPFRNSKILNFAINESSTIKRGSSFVVEKMVRDCLRDASISNPEMTIDEFVSTIPESWYTSPNNIKDKTCEKK